MKTSNYNFFVNTSNENTFILYNMLTGYVTLIDQELRDAIEGSKFDHIDNKILRDLKKRGFIVDDEVNEKKVCHTLANIDKFSRGICFIVWPTTICNLTCAYCDVAWTELPHQTMTEPVLKGVTNYIKEAVEARGCTSLSTCLAGGEPLLEPKLCHDFLEELHSWCEKRHLHFFCDLVTNGTLVNEKIVRELSPHLSQVDVTIHEAIWANKSSKSMYEKIIDGVRLLSRAKLCVVLRIALSKKTRDQVGEVLDDLIQRGIRDDPNIRVTYEMIKGSASPGCGSPYLLKDWCYTPEEEFEIMPELWQLAWKKGLKLNVMPRHQRVGCGPSTYGAQIITPMGIYNCQVRVKDQRRLIATISEDGKISDFKYPFYEILDRDPLQIKECTDCLVLPMCGGGCPMFAKEKYGTYNAPGCISKDLHLKRIALQLRTHIEHEYPEKIR